MYSRQECVKKYGSDYYVSQEIAAGKLFKLDKNVYSDIENVPEIAILSYKYPRAVITMQTAFYIHDLTDTYSDVYDFATDRDAAKIPDDRIRQYFVPGDLFLLGIETMNYRGCQISIYNKERMLVELIRYKSKLPYDYYKEIILNYRKLIPTLDIQQVQDFALASPKSSMILEILQSEVF